MKKIREIDVNNQESEKWAVSEETIGKNVTKVIVRGTNDGTELFRVAYFFGVDAGHYYLLSLDSAEDNSFENILDGMAETFIFSVEGVAQKYLVAEKSILFKKMAEIALFEAEEFKDSYGGVYDAGNNYGVCSVLEQRYSTRTNEVHISCTDEATRFAVSFAYPDSAIPITYCADSRGKVISGTVDMKTSSCVTAASASIFQKNAVASNVKDWKTFRSDEYGFELAYPPNWESKSTARGAVFRPLGMNEDWQWAVEVYPESEKGISDLLSDIKKSEDDRVGESKITVVDYHGNDFYPFALVVVTNDEIEKSVPHWERRIILLKHNGRVYFISNGAVKSDEYERFYRSLRFGN